MQKFFMPYPPLFFCDCTLSYSSDIDLTPLKWCIVCVCVQVFEGYGQTECTSGCTATLPHDVTAGHVGPPLVSALIKLVDVPDMNYFASRGDGEVGNWWDGGKLTFHTSVKHGRTLHEYTK